VDGESESFWTTTNPHTTSAVLIELESEKTFDRLLLRENINNGQRVELFNLEYWTGKGWKEFANGNTIGYKRLLRFVPVTTSKVRFNILSSRDCPELTEIGLYKSSQSIQSGLQE
jgi:alpha-L-fucosidase